MEHLDDAQITAYAKRALPPADLLAADDHLASCAACRGRARARADIGRAALPGDLLPIESHLTDDQLDGYVEGALAAAAKADVDRHLAACPPCAREVAEHSAWARTRHRPRWLPGIAAAAAILAVLIPAVAYWRSSHEAPGATVAGLETLSAAQQESVRAALTAGVARPPDFLAELRGHTEVLMGPSSGEAFRVTQPVATAVLTDRPTFEWEPLDGAESYEVLVVDAGLRQVAQGPLVSSTRWTLGRPLPRGQTYAWQVTALRRGERITTPAAPAPPARFRVVDAGTATALSGVAERHPGSHLLLGILYAQAGVRDEATRHLLLVPADDPSSAVATRTRELLQ